MTEKAELDKLLKMIDIRINDMTTGKEKVSPSDLKEIADCVEVWKSRLDPILSSWLQPGDKLRRRIGNLTEYYRIIDKNYIMKTMTYDLLKDSNGNPISLYTIKEIEGLESTQCYSWSIAARAKDKKEE